MLTFLQFNTVRILLEDFTGLFPRKPTNSEYYGDGGKNESFSSC